jgi:hypothetical protein
MHPRKACEKVIALLGERRTTSAGLLALDAEGRAGAAYRGRSLPVEGPDGPLEAARMS